MPQEVSNKISFVKDPVCFDQSGKPHLSEIIFMYIIMQNKTIFKHRRICKIFTANICAYYM
jgi:hypothetical protein